MPPKIKVAKEDVIKTSLKLIREKGVDSLNARTIASALNCSTQPIFSNFSTMNELQKATMESAYEIYQEYLNRETQNGKYPKYKAYGLAYVRFAIEEKELFKLLFMRDRTKEDTAPSLDFEDSVHMVMQMNNVSYEKAMLMHLEMWTCVHGIGVMIATSFLNLEWELISNMLSDVYQGIRAKHLSEEIKNDSN